MKHQSQDDVLSHLLTGHSKGHCSNFMFCLCFRWGDSIGFEMNARTWGRTDQLRGKYVGRPSKRTHGRRTERVIVTEGGAMKNLKPGGGCRHHYDEQRGGVTRGG